MSRLPGVAGSLFPHRYLTDAMPADVAGLNGAGLSAQQRRVRQWWSGVAAACGPATGLRALFDLVAMPLFGLLGFRARSATFERSQARAWLATRQGSPVGLVLLPWAERPSALWRDLSATARDLGAAWAFLFAPPYLSLVDVRGYATRRELEFTLPDALESPSFERLWWLARADAFDPIGTGATMSWIDALIARANGYQDRVREDLQHGVAEALACLSAAIDGGHRPSPRSQESPEINAALAKAPFDEALTIVYRILFLLFAESRELVPVHAPVYKDAYAIATLGRAARSDEAAGFWDGLAAVTRLSRLGCRSDDLIVRPFNGRLFSRAAAPSLERRARSVRRSARMATLDEAVRRTLVALGSRSGPAGREDINYADLGVEQLGTVYERVLDLDVKPVTDEPCGPEVPRSHRRVPHSERRKQTGTFYTPRALAEFVVRRTLAPLTAGATADHILRLRVLDPAMGSGAFLVAACRFLAAAYERALIDEGRLVPADLDEHQRADIRRLIAERCLAGVDQNPIAVQLARLSLWLATLAQGKPLSFLDHRLRTGNSLLGASPADLSRLPTRRPSPSAPLPLFEDDLLEGSLRRALIPLTAIGSRRDDTVADVRAKEALWSHVASTASPLHVWRQASSLWCARWFWPEHEHAPGPAESRALIDALLRGDRTLKPAHVAARLVVAADVSRRHGFFHWPLEFADVFYDGERALASAGFDAVLGNPPWEMLRQGSAGEPVPLAKDRRALMSFVRESGLYPSCDRGHLNLYQPFVERALTLARPGGRVGLVLPWSVAADDGARALRTRLLEESAVDTIVGLDNAEGIFPIHRGLRFLVLTTTLGIPTREIRARFGVRRADMLDNLPGRIDATEVDPFPIRLTPRLIRQVGGTAIRIPDVRRAGDLSLLERLTSQFPALGSPAGWNVSFGRELNATEDREHFGPVGLPILEGKHLAPFRVDTSGVLARIARSRARELLVEERFSRPRLGYRDVSGVANRVTLIAALIPADALTTHTIFCLRSKVPAEAQHFLCALLNSYVLNAIARMLMGGHLTTSLVEGLPVPLWSAADARHRRIAGLAARVSRGNTSSRATALLQALVAELYGLEPVEFEQVLDGFPLVPMGERQHAARVFRALARRSGRGPWYVGSGLL